MKTGGWIRRIWLAIGVIFAAIPGIAAAGDWPQILGPARNGQASGETLPPAGRQADRRSPGPSNSAAAMQGRPSSETRSSSSTALTTKSSSKRLDVASGKSLWKAGFEATYRPGIDPDDGPRCGAARGRRSRVRIRGSRRLAGRVRSMAKLLWERHLYADYGGDEGYFRRGDNADPGRRQTAGERRWPRRGNCRRRSGQPARRSGRLRTRRRATVRRLR